MYGSIINTLLMLAPIVLISKLPLRQREQLDGVRLLSNLLHKIPKINKKQGYKPHQTTFLMKLMNCFFRHK